MKIAVVGAGAMGSLFGALLAEAGNDVWLYDINAEHIAAVKNTGLTVEREGKVRKVKIGATTRADEIGRVKLVIIFVKSTQTKPAAETALNLLQKDAMVMSLQNGMGNAEIIADVIEPDRILAGTTSYGATMLGPGTIRHAGSGPTTIGGWIQTAQSLKRARQFAELFTRAGIETEALADVQSVVWDKLLVNIGINAVTALTGIRNGQILDLEATRQLSRAAVEEAAAVARASGVDVRKNMVEHVFNIAGATGTNRSSMGQDVDHRRQTEIGAINGFIVRRALKLGLKAPVNQTLTALIETLQFHYRSNR
jgi:2-dehydropantoate 2-reductase